MSTSNILVYLVRRDLRVSDNPVLHHLATTKDHGFTHLLPLFVFNARQVEVSGLIPEGSDAKNPYQEARSKVGGFWRCGPHRVKFLSESIWDLKKGLEKAGSGLTIRAGITAEVISDLLKKFDDQAKTKVGAVWMVGEEGVEESQEEGAVKDACREKDVGFRLWDDEKYLIDDRDIPLKNIEELSDVFTTYRKTVEPLRSHPRDVLPTPGQDSLPPYPSKDVIPSQQSPLVIPEDLDSLQNALLKPLKSKGLVRHPPETATGSKSAHPFVGGESNAQDRLRHLILSGSITTYHSTRNGLLGTDFSTKLSAYLALGCITARQIHSSLLSLEDGTDEQFHEVQGYGEGENAGTKAVRFELLWRDYMRLCTRKFGPKLFRLSGFKAEDEGKWLSPSCSSASATKNEVKEIVERFVNGTTGMGLIDASLREMFHTGYTSNRARQNVASFLAKHLRVDWRIGAEWYESMLVDYDLSSNWGNWQYLAGVGNDPRGEARIFNPVKQAFDYDPNGDYVKAWVPELRELTDPSEIFQAWTVNESRQEELGLKGLVGVEKPLKKIDFTVGKRGRHLGRPRSDRGNQDQGRGGFRGRGANRGYGAAYGGRGYGSTRGYYNASFRGNYSNYGRGGRDNRMGMMDRERFNAEENGTGEYAAY